MRPKLGAQEAQGTFGSWGKSRWAQPCSHFWFPGLWFLVLGTCHHAEKPRSQARSFLCWDAVSCRSTHSPGPCVLVLGMQSHIAGVCGGVPCLVALPNCVPAGMTVLCNEWRLVPCAPWSTWEGPEAWLEQCFKKHVILWNPDILPRKPLLSPFCH